MPKSDTGSMQVLSSLGVNSIPGFRHRESLSDPHVVSPVGPGLRLPGAGPFPAPAVSWASFTWCDCFSSGTEPELPGQLDVWEQGAGGAGRGRDGAPPSREDPGPSPCRREGRLGPAEEAVSCSPAMEAAERTAHRPWQKMGSGHIWPTFVAFSPQKPKCSVFFLCFLVVTWNLSQVHCGTMGLPGVWGEGAPLDFGWAGVWFRGLHVSPTAPGQGLRLCPTPRLIATRHGFLRAHGCRCSRRRAQVRGRNGAGPCPPHLKASVLADVT